jgi:predicted ester cyclase
MSTEENKALARSSFEEIMNNANLAMIDEVFSPNYVLHAPAGPVHGLDGFKQFVLMYRNTFPDARYTIEEIIGEGTRSRPAGLGQARIKAS